MSKDANSFGHDKALAWESRGFVYTKRGCIVSTHPLYDNGATFSLRITNFKLARQTKNLP